MSSLIPEVLAIMPGIDRWNGSVILSATPEGTRDRMNILLIALDTLRADHIGCYGYPRDTTPFLDEFARDATVFSHAFAPAIPTQPAYTTVFTGREALDHGIVAHGGRYDIRPGIPMLPELLKAEGYETCCVSTLPRMKPWFGRGWDEKRDPSRRTRYIQMVPADAINVDGLDWIKNRSPNGKWFLFLHYWDVHTPYMAPPGYRHRFYAGNPGDTTHHSMDEFYTQPFAQWWASSASDGIGEVFEGWITRLAQEAEVEKITDAEFLVSQYDSELAFLDDQLRALFGELGTLGALDDTAVVFFADHGEEMYEHGIYFDHHGLYEGNIRVPLIMRLPGSRKQPATIAEEVVHADISPTILDLADADIPAEMVGRSLVNLVRGEDEQQHHDDGILLCENSWMSKWGLRKGGYKYIKARAPDWHSFPPQELYHVAADPSETRNIVESETGIATEMDEELEARVDEGCKKYGRAQDPLVEQGLSPMGRRAFKWIKESGYW